MKLIDPLDKKHIHVISRYSLKGQLLETYPNARFAAEAMKTHQQFISMAARSSNKVITACGYVWRRGNLPEVDLTPILKERWLGPSPLSAQQHTVGQYDLEGNLITTYTNTVEAAKAVGVHKNGIRDVIKGRGLTYGGFVWSKTIKKKIKVNPQIELNIRTISQYDLNGRWIRSFKTGLDAARVTKIDNGSISNVLNGTNITAGGYIWRKGEKLRINVYELKKHPSYPNSVLQKHLSAKKSGTKPVAKEISVADQD